MALEDSQKLDYLWKKLAYGFTKTATPDNKEAYNESIPSPLIYRGDLVMSDSGSIPAVIPTESNSVVEIYKDNASGNNWTATVECSEDLTSPDNRTWKTNLENWIPPQFGSTYLVNVYVDSTGASSPQTTGTKLFQTGSGDNDEWFFDYQSGVLNFNGTNIPSQIATGVTGKSIYVSGAKYIGTFGVSGSEVLGNLAVANTTITSTLASGNIRLSPTNSQEVIIDTTSGLVMPTGNTAQRPSPADAGTVRFNSETGILEIYNGSDWGGIAGGGIQAQELNGDGSTTDFTLDDEPVNAASLLVAINGVVQLPDTAYTVSGNTITFAQAPVTTDIVDIRFL